MSQPPTKRRRIDANPFLDIEAAVDRADELEESEDENDRAFINDDQTEEEPDAARFAANMYRIRDELIDVLREDGALDPGATATAEEEEHAGLLREWLGLSLCDDDAAENPVLWRGDRGDPNEEDEEDEEEKAHTVPRLPWTEIAYNNAKITGARRTMLDDDPVRRISRDDTLYEVSCPPGMEETIAFRIYHWAQQVDALGPTDEHILEHFNKTKAPKPSLTPAEPEALKAKRKQFLLARSAIANPFLQGRVFIESAKIGYVQRLARRVRGLNPASVRPVPRELLLRPLFMKKDSFPDRTFVRLLDPPSPSMTCLIVKDYLLMVPRSASANPESFTSAGRFNVDTHAMPDPPPESRTGEPMSEDQTVLVPLKGSISVDQYGFRYIPLRMLGPSALEAYEPSAPEIELLFRFGRLNNRHYRKYMSRVMAYTVSAGDRVILQGGTYDQLVGTVLDPSDSSACSIYVPSQGTVLQVTRQQLRRHFCIGDRVSATTDDIVQKLGSRIGWVVGSSEGYKAAWSSIEETDSITSQPRSQVGYRVDLRVYSPESGKEIAAAHYEFQFEDDSTVSLLRIPPPSPVSEMTVGTPYTLSVPVTGLRSQSFFGIITAIEGVHVRHSGTDTSTDLSATVVFSIWDKSENAPFGFSDTWPETMVDFMDFDIRLGDIITLKDQEGKWGTARITRCGRRDLSLANFTGALKVSDLESFRRVGPYDKHIGKTVRVVKGPYRGGLGIVKTANTIGICTVELSVLPIRVITVNIVCLRAVDESAVYLSLLPILEPPPRAQTPPAPELSADNSPAWQPSASDASFVLPQSPDRNCSWLARPFVQGIPVKLKPVHRTMERPYHFSHTFVDHTRAVPQLIIRVFDRKNQRDFAADELSWLPANDINQTVIKITGEDNGTLYWTVLVDGDYCQVRQVPSKRGAPLFIFSRFELAQVVGKRK